MENQIPNAIQSLTTVLAENIIRSVPFELWDECIEDLWKKLGEAADKKYKISASTLLNAEVMHKGRTFNKQARYQCEVDEN